MDFTTVTAFKGMLRACVKVDLSKPLLPFVAVMGCLQAMEYER